MTEKERESYFKERRENGARVIQRLNALLTDEQLEKLRIKLRQGMTLKEAEKARNTALDWYECAIMSKPEFEFQDFQDVRMLILREFRELIEKSGCFITQ